MSNKEPLQLSPSTKRLFFALWPDDDVVQKIKQHTLKQFSECQGKIVKQTNWHITLAYFGMSDAATQACLEEQVKIITSQPFELNLSICGYWPRPKVAWLAPDKVPDELKQLIHDLQHAIIPCGFKPETREYLPHITLVRKAKTNPAVLETRPITMKVSRFCLVESKTYPEGAEYKVLKSWDL